MSDEDGLKDAWFELADFKKNSSDLVKSEDFIAADGVTKLPNFPFSNNFSMVIISTEEDEASMLAKMSKIPNLDKFHKVRIL